jgi:hypothetical protein
VAWTNVFAIGKCTVAVYDGDGVLIAESDYEANGIAVAVDASGLVTVDIEPEYSSEFMVYIDLSDSVQSLPLRITVESIDASDKVANDVSVKTLQNVVDSSGETYSLSGNAISEDTALPAVEVMQAGEIDIVAWKSLGIEYSATSH